MKSVVVYCGSSQSLNPIYRNVALDLGESLARRKLNLVYGGGCTGLMGIVADTVMSHGGTVTGFIPRAMASREVAHYGITCLHIVDNMHQRKAMMLDMADAVIALPGGIGTLEEWAEAITWLSLGYHQKPCGLINYHGFYDPLLAQLQRMSDEGFLRKSWMKNILHADNPDALLDLLATHLVA